MKYLIMLYGNPMTREWWAALSDEEKNEAAGGHFAINEALAASGEMIVTQALADPATGQRVSLVDGRAVTSDGPFAEVKEYLAGFYLVDVDSPERAVEIAGQFPEAEWGLVEVRPILELGGGSDV